MYVKECLNGGFIAVGSNPKFDPIAGYHWFDGDGMLHGLRIKDGRATYVSRYIRTSRLKQEEYFSSPKFVKVGDLKGQFGVFMYALQLLREKFKVIDLSFGYGTGNTSLIYHNGMLLALHERDKPYVIKVMEDGDLQTLGILDYDKQLHHSFSAHPKIDPVTDEMFSFGYDYLPPYLTYRVITKDGAMLDPVLITIPNPSVMHDFAITKNYAIFMDLPAHIMVKNLIEGKYGISFDETMKSRFGILPRYAKDDSQIKWFELPSCYVVHIANAWEEGDEVVLFCCRHPSWSFNADDMVDTSKLTSKLYEMRFNMKSGASSQRQLSVSFVELPRINERYVGRKQRYVYASIFEKTEIVGFAKFDLAAEPESGKKSIEVGGNIQSIFKLCPGKFGSEAVYVPRQLGHHCNEDDGYLIFFAYDENMGKSEVIIIDAKTMSSEPVAVVDLPTRVPQTLHSIFMHEGQLNNQHKF